MNYTLLAPLALMGSTSLESLPLCETGNQTTRKPGEDEVLRQCPNLPDTDPKEVFLASKVRHVLSSEPFLPSMQKLNRETTAPLGFFLSHPPPPPQFFIISF